MLKPINSIIKESIGNIIYRGNVVTGTVAIDNGNGSYDVFISESDRAYPKIFTLSRNPNLAVGDKVRILYKNGCKELPIILPPVAASIYPIDIGSEAIERSSWAHLLSGHTRILKENPANNTGRITSVEIWAEINLTGTIIATFNEISPNVFTARDSYAIGNVTAGSKQTFEVNLNVVEGDFIGLYYSSGKMIATISGDGYWGYDGDQTACSGLTFELVADRTISLYGSN